MISMYFNFIFRVLYVIIYFFLVMQRQGKMCTQIRVGSHFWLKICSCSSNTLHKMIYSSIYLYRVYKRAILEKGYAKITTKHFTKNPVKDFRLRTIHAAV